MALPEACGVATVNPNERAGMTWGPRRRPAIRYIGWVRLGMTIAMPTTHTRPRSRPVWHNEKRLTVGDAEFLVAFDQAETDSLNGLAKSTVLAFH